MTEIINTIDALGQTWTFARADRVVRARYAARVKAHARKGLADDKPTMDAEMYRDFVAILQDRIDSGDYSWGDEGCGSAVQAMLESTLGQVWLLQELLRPTHGEVAIEKIGEIALANPIAVRIALLAAFGLPAQEPTA